MIIPAAVPIMKKLQSVAVLLSSNLPVNAFINIVIPETHPKTNKIKPTSLMIPIIFLLSSKLKIYIF